MKKKIRKKCIIDRTMPSPSVASQASSQQAATQFLNSVLSQRGPNALPYAEDVKWSIRQHLLAVVQVNRPLSVFVGFVSIAIPKFACV